MTYKANSELRNYNELRARKKSPGVLIYFIFILVLFAKPDNKLAD